MTDQISFPPLHDPPPGELELRKQHLLSEITREPMRRSLPEITFPHHHIRLAIAPVLAAASAAVIVGVLSIAGQHAPPLRTGQGATAKKTSSSSVIPGLGGSPPTMAYPLGQCCGRQVSLADAASELGGPLTLPDSAQVKPSDAGAAWAESANGEGQSLVDVAVSFPKQGLIVRYARPPIPDPLSNYQVAVSSSEGSLIYLNGGVPALADESQLQDGSNWGFVQFVAGGTTIVVMGHPDEEALQSVAQSILDQMNPG